MIQAAPVPAEKSASNAPAYALGTGTARPAPERWFWVPDDDSHMVDGGAAASSSGGAAEAPETEAKSSLEGAAGTSRSPFISCIEVDAVASVREGQVDVGPHQFHCSTGIMVSGVKTGSLTRCVRYLTMKRESSVSVRLPYAHCKNSFMEST